MKLIIKIVILLLFTINLVARETGETEITTEDGIEVFQNEKYYLLKKNVTIVSDNFFLKADDVKVNFDKNLYDISQLSAKGNVNFKSNLYSMTGNSKFLEFQVKIEKLRLEGEGSELITKDIKMISDGIIEVNNLSGDFSLHGLNSKLSNENILIIGNSINGIFSDTSEKREINFLKVFDEKISYIKNKDTEMYAKTINFKSDKSIIELLENVTIIRNDEKITGDYGTLDTKNNSYKVKSSNKSKVKVIIQNNE